MSERIQEAADVFEATQRFGSRSALRRPPHFAESELLATTLGPGQ